MIGKDKLLHMSACFVITFGVFLLLVAARGLYKSTQHPKRIEDGAHPSDRNDEEASRSGDVNIDETMSSHKCNLHAYVYKNWVLAVIASSFAMLIGIAKEIGDVYNYWWLCKAQNEDGSVVGCDASWTDILADVVGVILANCIIFVSIWIWTSLAGKKTEQSADYTMARTISDA